MSGLWGVVRGGDLVPDYRVPASGTVPGFGGVSAHWRPSLRTAMPALVGDQPVLDLRSTDYRGMWKPGPRAARPGRDGAGAGRAGDRSRPEDGAGQLPREVREGSRRAAPGGRPPAAHRPDGGARRRRGGAGPAGRGRPRAGPFGRPRRSLNPDASYARAGEHATGPCAPRGAAGRAAGDAGAPDPAAPRAAHHRRLVLPRRLRTARRQRRVGHEGAAAPAHRPADRDLAARRRGAPPGQPRQRRARPAGRAQPDDGGPRDQPRRDLAAGSRRLGARAAALGRAAGAAPRLGTGVRAPRRPAAGPARRRGSHRAAGVGGGCHLAGARLHADRRRGGVAGAGRAVRAAAGARVRARPARALRRADRRRRAAGPRVACSTSRPVARRWCSVRARPAAGCCCSAASRSTRSC